VQWCPVIHIPRLLVSPFLAQVLHHREVTIVCCLVQWCPIKINISTADIAIHLRSLHHSIHNVQLFILTGFNKATIVGQVLGFITATLGVSQVQLPAPRIVVSQEEHSAQGINRRECIE